MTWPSFDSAFSTRAITEAFSPESTVEALLAFESALALSLADVGLAPADEALAVAAACEDGVADPEAVLATWRDTGTPLIELRSRVTARIGEETARRWFHFGATTQDAVDTAASLQARRAIDAILADLMGLAGDLRDLAATHRSTAQMGRTFLQDAAPVTFGLRAATWLDAVLDHISELRAARAALSVHLGGPTGTRSDYGSNGTGLVETLARRLELQAPSISRQPLRGDVHALAHTVERTAATMAKIAGDIAYLASSEIAEVTVRSGGSSSMPGKRNPIDSVRAVAAASACHGAVTMMTGASPALLERGVGQWHVEWLAMPLAFHTAGAAVEAMAGSLGSLAVDTAAMASRVDPASIESLIEAIDPQIDAVLARFEETN